MYKQTQIINENSPTFQLWSQRMSLWNLKVSCCSIESFGHAAAGSPAMSAAKRRLQIRSSSSSGTSDSLLLPAHCHVLYVDRGVIVLNKPPGLVSQATAPSHDALPTTRTRTRTCTRAAPAPAPVVDVAISRKNINRRQVAAPPPPPLQTAVFDDVLYGGSQWGKKN